jgi:hypothetical protein
MRTLTGVAPTAGRPRDFLALDIDFPISGARNSPSLGFPQSVQKETRAMAAQNTIRSPKQSWKDIGAQNFDPMEIDLSRLMTNEELGMYMRTVRLAAVLNQKSKVELIAIVRKLDDESGNATIDLLEDARQKLQSLSKFCESAFARIAIAVAADEKKSRHCNTHHGAKPKSSRRAQ